MGAEEPPAWLGELAFRSEAPWLAMSTRALGRAPLLLPEGGDGPAMRARKLELLTIARHVVSVGTPYGRRAAEEAAALISAAAASSNTAPGPAAAGSTDGAGTDLERAAVLVPEDLAVLVRHDGAWRLAAGVICFPSHWSPAAKLGQSVADLHGPVPHYAGELAARVDRFLDRLQPGRPAWRRNWTIHASAELHAPVPVTPPAPVAPGAHWLRSERQVLAALPASGGILFTIRTQQVPLHEAAPVVAGELAAALRALPPELAAYRSGPVDLPAVVAWLAGQEEKSARRVEPAPPRTTSS